MLLGPAKAPAAMLSLLARAAATLALTPVKGCAPARAIDSRREASAACAASLFWNESVVRPAARLGGSVAASLDSLTLSALELAADVLPTSMKETRFFFFALRIGPMADTLLMPGAFFGGVPNGLIAADMRVAFTSPKVPACKVIVFVSFRKESSSPGADERESLTR